MGSTSELMDQVNNTKKQRWPFYDDDEIAAVNDVLLSGRVNQWGGQYVHRFQEFLASRVGVPHAIAVANGSLALELALRSFGIGPGDEVIVTSRSFIASASCVSIVGARPIFADVDWDSGNISAASIEPHISENTKAIIPVHLGGWPCDMPQIMALAERHDLIVIEDCAQAIGAEIDGNSVGSFGHASIFSFCQDKIISTGGEGGAVCFNSSDAWLKAWSYKDHGKDWQITHQTDNTPWFKYLHMSIGTNMRMTEMQAAIGIIQLGKLDNWLKIRHKNAMIWRDGLKGCHALRIPIPSADIKHAYYRFYVYMEPENLRNPDKLNELRFGLQKANVKVANVSCPELYREPAFASMAVSERPVAAELGRTNLAFLTHPTLDQIELKEKAKMAADILNFYVRK